MKHIIKQNLEKFSKAIVQPLMYLSVVGMLLIIGIILTNKSIIEAVPFLGAPAFQFIGTLIYTCLMFLINNLSIIFCVGIAAALTSRDKGHAALVSLMSYFIFLNANNATMKFFDRLAEQGPMGLYGTGQSTILGIQVLDTGVFSGIIIGCLCGFAFNKLNGKSFKGYFSMYSGVRFPFLIMIITSILLGITFTFVWPMVQNGITMMTNFIKDTGNLGLFSYGFLNKFLVPTGLHHLIYTPFQFTDVGGTLVLGEQIISGAYPIRLAEMNMVDVPFSDTVYYNSYTFNNLFPYIGIGFAFIVTSFKENKEKTKAIIIPLMLTAILSSITEPLDFLFVFVSPILFLIHSIISGIFLVLLEVLQIPAATSGGIVNLMISNLAVGAEKSAWPMLLVLGAVSSVVYYFLFVFFITKFNLKTPGREIVSNVQDTPENKKEVSEELEAKNNVNKEQEQLKNLIRGLGGKENIINLENCFTRLRITVEDEKLVNEDLINQVENKGIKRYGKDIQVIFGVHVIEIRTNLSNILDNM